eukprot:CAMPEP_0206834964 /NCGR_PEP_ID=MMETSP0975-20121206/19156_1 /ASSEMBLY_ACC=CAM_ASM_000399 /TAXON_ID=483370 /ORGANISM="non described non described, Strain CCMP2097" /LENGTH=51 /DNA_ID=CAMNT_0054377357 /DNA_START=37 /DNA_END=190 /DNA_ORIENTATION=-
MIAVASTSAQRSGWNLSASWKKRFFTSPPALRGRSRASRSGPAPVATAVAP